MRFGAISGLTATTAPKNHHQQTHREESHERFRGRRSHRQEGHPVQHDVRSITAHDASTSDLFAFMASVTPIFTS
ncbi:hypothetical protein N136_02281 [Leifsonia aquatica ATCC 14665]|uniref:Uncharacterized protein n=1 Tax=Leifsonia aquatica ATCC 14665 TaxID=1358026 RepID=U2RS26_LEIAQ|nr:hypothetical protein N136_02281 [Leifsonia aquatica ATCC 14665]